MNISAQIACPGCELVMPREVGAHYAGHYNTCAECWGVYTEVLGRQFSNVILFSRAHQLAVDAYAAQHAGGPHPDKSVVVHLCGLYLVLEAGARPTSVPKLFQRLAARVETWPHMEPVPRRWSRTVFDAIMADEPEDHTAAVRAWAESVWSGWADRHEEIRRFVSLHLR